MDGARTLDGGPLPIDLEHLSRSGAESPAVTREALMIFRDEADAWAARMTPDCAAEVWRDAAQALQGAAKRIGAWPIARLCHEAEALAEPGGEPAGLHARRALHDTLRAEIARTRHYIEQVIEPLAG